ncbi:MAG TPA: hypothetical protein DCE78_04290 [Bacteroidetes bacterium]|nr:hypothetical protein [Bacteroidota bacterium]
MIKFYEGHGRTLAKVISWRVLLTISHILNGFFATGNWVVGFQIAGTAAIINSFLFWIHERGWNIFQWNRNVSQNLIFSEGNTRSLSKIITWRILITGSNFLIPFILTGSLGSAVLFAGLATVINMFLFWSHERIWNFLKWKKTVKES